MKQLAVLSMPSTTSLKKILHKFIALFSWVYTLGGAGKNKPYSICSYILFILIVAHCIGIYMMKNPDETSYWYYYNGMADSSWITFKLQSHYFWPESVLIYIYTHTPVSIFLPLRTCVWEINKEVECEGKKAVLAQVSKRWWPSMNQPCISCKAGASILSLCTHSNATHNKQSASN